MTSRNDWIYSLRSPRRPMGLGLSLRDIALALFRRSDARRCRPLNQLSSLVRIRRSIQQKKSRHTGGIFLVGRNDWIYSGLKSLTLRAACGVAYAIDSAEPLRWSEPLLRNLFIKKPPASSGIFINGRNDWIRTSDPYVPNVVLYQAEPRSDKVRPL